MAVPLSALFFDVFGTVVDWRSSVIHQSEALGNAKGLTVDWPAFADAWRAKYQPTMEEVRSGRRPWIKLDHLHRESLEQLLTEYGIDSLSDHEIDHLNRVWHRLDPWSDSVPGIRRLQTRYIVAPLSNGNVALLVEMARRVDLHWDVILGAEIAQHYKPQPEAYLKAAALLDLDPGQCMMVAAHNDDLRAAASLGFQTAFVARPMEYGPNQQKDLCAEENWDIVVETLEELAARLGC